MSVTALWWWFSNSTGTQKSNSHHASTRFSKLNLHCYTSTDSFVEHYVDCGLTRAIFISIAFDLCLLPPCDGGSQIRPVRQIHRQLIVLGSILLIVVSQKDTRWCSSDWLTSSEHHSTCIGIHTSDVKHLLANTSIPTYVLWYHTFFECYLEHAYHLRATARNMHTSTKHHESHTM